jgi:chorismate dehydratase
MPTPENLPKLRMAPVETPEELARRFERETRPGELQRESQLENSLGDFKVGSVPYLNAAPLTRGLEDQIAFAPPSELARMLRRDELDAALVSITEVLLNDRYDILEGVAVASLGEVKSVFLAHRQPLENIREIFCDTASLSSVNLLKVLLAERGLNPAFEPLPNYGAAAALENVLLIGDPAIDFARSGTTHEIWDLGEAWFELTQLPFVYAVWALRRRLREAKNFGLDTLDHIISSRTEFDYAFRKDYLSWHIHYHLGAEERRGITRFIELLRKHQLGPAHEPRFVA